MKTNGTVVSSSPIELHPPRKVTIVQSIIDQILAQIRSQALKPGDRLPSERELIGTLGVSRSSVREALQGLIAMNVLESRPGQGTFVKPHAASTLWQLPDVESSAWLRKKMRLDLLHTRAIVDEEVAQLAAQNGDEAALAEIAVRFSEYERCVQARDRIRLPLVHSEFHIAIAQAGDNYFLLQATQFLLNEAVPNSLRNPEYQFGEAHWPEAMLQRDVANHRAICTAITARDPELIREAIHHHVELTRSLIEADFSEVGD